ncbi:MAG TPA: amidase [Pseudonocardiaceae bacterium]|nr:amidase [Pseudonocardiaceae bacterium]
MTGDPAELTAIELLAAYRTGDLSPVEACDAVLARIADADPVLNAFRVVDEQRARKLAAESADRWLRGEQRGLLDGVPVSIKDVLYTEGWATLRGSRAIDPDQPWQEDSPAVARLREHGVVAVGKTTTPELAWKAVTDSPLTGITRNPWDPTRTPGGSSGGAAAAVAAGMAPLALGTDGGGSVRIPAAFTGTVTLKPTYGVVPHFPASAFGTLAHTGPITRTVADAALMLDVISGPDYRDWSALPAPVRPFAKPQRTDVRGLRIAYSPTLGFPGAAGILDAEVAAAVARAAALFESLGAHVEAVDPPINDPIEEFHVLWFAGAAASVAALPGASRDQLDPGLTEIAEAGAALSAVDYLRANNMRMAMGLAMGKFHTEYDLLLTPTTPIPAFEAGLEVPANWPMPRWTSWTPFTYPFNMTQQPAASMPCGFTAAGLPIGVQVVGPRHSDALILAACTVFEQAQPWWQHRPPVSGSQPSV